MIESSKTSDPQTIFIKMNECPHTSYSKENPILCRVMESSKTPNPETVFIEMNKYPHTFSHPGDPILI